MHPNFILIFVVCFSKFTFALICPNEEQNPITKTCSCGVVDGPAFELRCRFSQQSDINKMMTILKEINGISDDDWLTFKLVEIVAIAEESLDLAPFFKSRIVKLDVHSSSHLKSIKSSKFPDFSNENFIEVVGLFVQWNAKLDDAGFGETLKLFGPSMQKLSLCGNKFTGTQNSTSFDEHAEFLPGFSSLKNLRKVELKLNSIEILKSVGFYSNSKLRKLDFAHNQIQKVEENAFLIGSTPAEFQGKTLEINLDGNELNETSFPKFLGTENILRPIILSVENNQMKTIPEIPLQHFLQFSNENILNVFGNPLKCDENLNWLKNKTEFQNRILGGNCRDQWTNNIFNFTDFKNSPPKLKCPRNPKQIPCACESLDGEISLVRCSSNDQNDIKITLSKIRKANGMSENDWLFIKNFEIVQTQIKTLDLASLFKLRIFKLDIFYNFALEKLISSKSPDFSSRDFVDVVSLFVQWNSQLNDHGFSDILKIFSPKLQKLFLAGNGLIFEGSKSVRNLLDSSQNSTDSDTTKFLNSIFLFENLVELNFCRNPITKIPTNAFKQLTKLRKLDLSVMHLNRLEENSLFFNDPPREIGRQILEINLENNQLTENSFPEKLGLENFTRPVEFLVVNNQIKSLPRSLAAFLNKNRGNALNFVGNSLVSDAEIRWVKNNSTGSTELIQKGFFNNERGETVFAFAEEPDDEKPQVNLLSAAEFQPDDENLMRPSSENALIGIICTAVFVGGFFLAGKYLRTKNVIVIWSRNGVKLDGLQQENSANLTDPVNPFSRKEHNKNFC